MLMTARSEVAIPDPGLLQRFDVPGPRYTSYPTADRFVEAFDAEAFANALAARAAAAVPSALSLYVHVPYCFSPCFYCGCNRIITRDQSRARPYLERLKREIRMLGDLFDRDHEAVQVNLGGGGLRMLDDIGHRLLTDP